MSYKGHKASLKLPLLLILSLIIIYCGGSNVVGTYYSPGYSGDILEINKDGSFYCKDDDIGLSGTWQVKNNNLRLTLAAGITVECRLVDDKIVDNEGKVWLKKK